MMYQFDSNIIDKFIENYIDTFIFDNNLWTFHATMCWSGNKSIINDIFIKF